jgi:TolB-like protein
MVAGGLLIASLVLTVWYLVLPTLSTQEAQLALPDKPSIVVLPFVNLSDDPGQKYFSDGITEDLTADLSKISSLFVISRNTAATYEGKPVKVPEVSKELGVQYVLEGRVRKADGQVRITAQLIDATKDTHLRSEQIGLRPVLPPKPSYRQDYTR